MRGRDEQFEIFVWTSRDSSTALISRISPLLSSDITRYSRQKEIWLLLNRMARTCVQPPTDSLNMQSKQQQLRNVTIRAMQAVENMTKIVVDGVRVATTYPTKMKRM